MMPDGLSGVRVPDPGTMGLLLPLGETPGVLKFAREVVPAGRLLEGKTLIFWSAEAVVDEKVMAPLVDPFTVEVFVELIDPGEIEEGDTVEPLVDMDPLVNGSSAVPHTAAGASLALMTKKWGV